jgi:hypothetical protein
LVAIPAFDAYSAPTVIVAIPFGPDVAITSTPEPTKLRNDILPDVPTTTPSS